MSIDRRIVSILYHNGIFDVDEVEKFIGEKGNYYEVVINGKLEKLKIPGNDYIDDINTEFEDEEKTKYLLEKSRIQREEIAETLSQIVNEDEEFVKEKILKIELEPDISFEEELKKSDDENTAFLEKIKEVKKEPKSKKIPAKKSKVDKIDDIDDFMNIL